MLKWYVQQAARAEAQAEKLASLKMLQQVDAGLKQSMRTLMSEKDKALCEIEAVERFEALSIFVKQSQNFCSFSKLQSQKLDVRD